MNTLNLENVNRQAPYRVTTDINYPYLYYFYTDYGLEYEITCDGKIDVDDVVATVNVILSGN